MWLASAAIVGLLWLLAFTFKRYLRWRFETFRD